MEWFGGMGVRPDRAVGAAQHLFRHGSEQKPPERPVTVGRHHDQVDLVVMSVTQNLGGGVAFYEGLAGVHSGEKRPPERSQVFLSAKAKIVGGSRRKNVKEGESGVKMARKTRNSRRGRDRPLRKIDGKQNNAGGK